MSQSVSPSPPKAHNVVLDALRGIAALAVFLSHADHAHLFYAVGPAKAFLGRFGVDLFFMLSGFLIWRTATATIARPHGLSIYAVHRATRLVPLYAACLLYVVFLLPLAGSDFHPEVTPETVWRHLTFTQALLPPVSKAINPVLWTITHEVLFYALVPLLVSSRRRVALLLLLLVSAVPLTPAAAACGPLEPFVGVLHLFAIGILAAQLAEQELHPSLSLLVIALASLAALTGIDEPLSAELAAAAVLAVALAGSNSAANPITVAALRPLAGIGTISYSLYVWHYLLLNLLSAHDKAIAAALAEQGIDWHDGDVRALVTGAAMLLVATASYRLIERPGMTSLRHALITALTGRRRASSSSMERR